MFEKLEAILKRFNELTASVSDPEVVKRREEWQSLVKERASLEEVAEKYTEYPIVELTVVLAEKTKIYNAQ